MEMRQSNKVLNYSGNLMHINPSNKNTPSYIFSNGIDPIRYYDFKHSNQLRSMGVLNPLFYLVFIYNTFIVFKPLFYKLYNNSKYQKLIKTSDSSILEGRDVFRLSYYNDNITLKTLYKKSEISNLSKNFKKNLITRSLLESYYPYYMTLDIQSFFPSIYTHNFDRLQNSPLYESLIKDSQYKDTVNKYFHFLDKYNMKNNNDQTIGILVGSLSSSISAELLSLNIYNQAMTKGIFDDVKYTRFVDDVVVFSKDPNNLKRIHFRLGNLLRSYGLSLQNKKYQISKGIYIPKVAKLSSINNELMNFINKQNPKLFIFKSINSFLDFKIYIENLIKNKEYSTINYLFGILKYKTIKFTYFNKIYNKHIFKKIFVDFLIKIAISYPYYATNIYKFLQQQIKTNKNIDYDRVIYKELINSLNNIDYYFPFTTVLQIWTYYLLNLLLDKHQSDLKRKNIKYDLFRRCIKYSIKPSPLIIMCFISNNNNSKLNNTIFNFILRDYKQSISKTTYLQRNLKKLNKKKITENQYNEWYNNYIHTSIMFSKWAFPLYKIYAFCNYKNKDLEDIFRNKSSILFGELLSNLYNYKKIKTNISKEPIHS